MGQKITTTQFYLHGKKNFTVTGWKKAQEYYKQGFLENIDLTGKTYMITGANSGLGKEVTQYVASRGGTVYMVCRSKERAEAARDTINADTGNKGHLHLLLGDVSLRADVIRLMAEFSEKEQKLDALVCNAGTITDDKTLSTEGVEVTFACHLLYGCYLLGKEAMGVLAASGEGRCILVSSGGMYNTKFPALDTATATDLADAKFDGQLAYAYAKRGQVLLAEQWTESPPNPAVKVVSCHPGWVRTPGVMTVYGDKSKYLEPMRTPWQGAEGIAWLAVAPTAEIEGGSFYLDRKPQTKHLAGYFMGEGTFTKNSPEEVKEMMDLLEKWSLAPPGK